MIRAGGSVGDNGYMPLPRLTGKPLNRSSLPTWKPLQHPDIIVVFSRVKKWLSRPDWQKSHEQFHSLEFFIFLSSVVFVIMYIMINISKGRACCPYVLLLSFKKGERGLMMIMLYDRENYQINNTFKIQDKMHRHVDSYTSGTTSCHPSQSVNCSTKPYVQTNNKWFFYRWTFAACAFCSADYPS